MSSSQQHNSEDSDTQQMLIFYMRFSFTFTKLYSTEYY